MHLISETKLKKFFRKYPDSETALRKFIKVVKNANWQNLADIKQDYNSVDYLDDDRYCFNIRGNNYRLIVVIYFHIGRIYVRFVGTHQEYDRLEDASNV